MDSSVSLYFPSLIAELAESWQDFGIAISMAHRRLPICKCLFFHTCSKNMKVRQSSMPKGNLKAVSVVVSLLIGCNKELMANSRTSRQAAAIEQLG